jgi:DNA-directed RNA polymerase subunit RPC12/RpoP
VLTLDDAARCPYCKSRVIIELRLGARASVAQEVELLREVRAA